MIALVAVHPHARGEHFCKLRHAHRRVRFIPTPVGNTVVSPLDAL